MLSAPGSGSLCPPVCLSATVPGLDAHLSAGESEAQGSLAVLWGGLGADPRLCGCSGHCILAGSDGQKGIESTARELARGRGGGGALSAVEHPAWLQPPTRGAPGPLTPDWRCAFKTGPGAGALTLQEEAGQEQVARVSGPSHPTSHPRPPTPPHTLSLLPWHFPSTCSQARVWLALPRSGF